MNPKLFRSLLSLTCICIALAACVPSLHPFYLPKQIATDDKIVGVWRSTEANSEDKETWEFLRADDRYELIISEDSKRGTFIATMFVMDKDKFMDITPKACEFAANQVDMVNASMIRGHMLLRFTQTEPELKFAILDPDFFEKELKANPKAIAHLTNGDQFVLTATTPELQKFITKHKKEAFGEEVRMTRKAQ